MATVKDLAAYVCDKLAGKVLIHRYDAYSTNSVNLKIEYGLGNTLRLSDHTGKAGLNNRINIIIIFQHHLMYFKYSSIRFSDFF